MQEDEPNFDVKKVVVALVFLAIIGWVGYQNRVLFLGTSTTKEVAGAEISVTPTSTAKVTIPNLDLQQKIQDITTQVSHLDVKEVAGSSPQVQKVLKDMESLKDLPRSQAKDACLKLCSSL